MTPPAKIAYQQPRPVPNDRVLVFIPAYNEEGAIRNVVTGVRLTVPNADVLVIDDGSSDHTSSEARAAGAIVVRHPFNLGIGGAMQTGLKYAEQYGYDYAVRLDGDGQHSTSEIVTFLNVLRAGDADMVIGSRFLESSYDWDIPRTRWMGIRLYSADGLGSDGTHSTDTTSGFCGMNRQAICVLAKYLPQDYPGCGKSSHRAQGRPESARTAGADARADRGRQFDQPVALDLLRVQSYGRRADIGNQGYCPFRKHRLSSQGIYRWRYHSSKNS